MLRFVEMLEHFGQADQLAVYKPTVQLIAQLMNLNDGKEASAVNPLESARLDAHKLGGIISITLPEECSKLEKQFFYRQQMVLAYYLDDIELANKMSSKLGDPFIEGPVSWLPPRLYFQGLVAVAMFRSTRKRCYHKQAKSCLQKLRRFTHEGNVNCHHMFLILEAESLSLSTYNKKLKRTHIASVCGAYNKAIVSAGRLGFLNDQALANELCGAYCLTVVEDASLASIYLTRAHHLYVRWGATGKVKQLDHKYGTYLAINGSTEYDSALGTGLKARPQLDGIVHPSERSNTFQA